MSLLAEEGVVMVVGIRPVRHAGGGGGGAGEGGG